MNALWRHVRRAYSTSRSVQPSPPLHSPHRSRADRFIQLLGEQTKNSTLELVTVLNRYPEHLQAALGKCNITLEEYNRWRPILVQPDLDSAVEVMKEKGIEVDLKTNPSSLFQPLPSWVALFAAGFMIRSYQQAHNVARALKPVSPEESGYSNGQRPLSSPVNDTVPPRVVYNQDELATLLILNALHLSRYGLPVPLRELVKDFTSPLHQFNCDQYNLFLQALATAPTYSPMIETEILTVLNAMRRRRFDIQTYSFKRLTGSSAAGVKLATYFKRQLTRKDLKWQAIHHEALMRLLSKLAGENLLPIRAVKEHYDVVYSKVNGRKHPTIPISESTLFLSEPQNRANLHYVMALRNREKAFKLLNTLIDPAHPQISDHPSDIYAYTAVLSIAAKDHRVTDEDLVWSFRNIPRSIQPTSTTYFMLIRGLFERKSPLTTKLWDEFCDSALPIDKYILSLGLRVLTRAGRPHLAFSFLETHTRPTDGASTNPSIKVSAVTINDYLVSLNRIGRPDLVHFVFDNMWTLFHTLPDSRSLSILQFGTRIMRRLDNSLAGVLAELLRNPFRTPQSTSHSEVPLTREEAIQGAKKIIGSPDMGIIPYKPRLWHNETAVHRAITIFQQAMFGANPDLLRTVRSPVYAIRAKADEDPAAGFGGLLPKFARPIDPTMDTKSLDALLNEDGTTKYPSIVVTNDNVIRGIILLGLGSRIPEIPLMLAWMKALKIRPSPSTLAVSLVFWEEVSFEAPLMEKLSGEENNQYDKLWNWMKDWVGEEGMPSAALMRTWKSNMRKLEAHNRSA